MKALILILLVSIGINAQAMDVNPDQMNPSSQAQLMEVLIDLEPEMVNILLSDEAFDWYVDQLRKGAQRDGIEMSEFHGRVDLGSNPYEDENAPTF